MMTIQSLLNSTHRLISKQSLRSFAIPASLTIGFVSILTIGVAQDSDIALLGFHNTPHPIQLNAEVTQALPNGAEIRVQPHHELPDASVLINNKEVIHYRTRKGSDTPYERAVKTAKRLHEALNKNPESAHIFAHMEKNSAKIKLGKATLAVIDTDTANAAKNTVNSLAITWTSLLQDALGVKQAPFPKNILPKGTFEQSGFASWYGPQFHGRRAADGSIYNMYEYTAAHKRLPFGTLVKVTNVKNNQSVVVKITDRGPFIHGRIIDLSKAAAQEIGLTQSGVAPVQIQTLNMTKSAYRLPAPTKPLITVKDHPKPSTQKIAETAPTPAPLPSIEMAEKPSNTSPSEQTTQTVASTSPSPATQKVNDPDHEGQVPVSFLDTPVAAPAVSAASGESSENNR